MGVRSHTGARGGTGARGTSAAAAAELVGTLQNVSTSGALLRIGGAPTPSVGAGLELTFRLPTGPQLRLSSTVRWSRRDDPSEDASCGLEFLGVSGVNRAYLDNYVEQAATREGLETLRADVVHKYELSFDADGRVSVALGGLLTRDEAQAFCAMLERRISARKNAPLRIAIDLRRLSVCSQEVVVELRRCFELVARCPECVGFLIGDKSLALTQLVRAARDAGVADHLFCVNEPEDAWRIWSQMGGVSR